MAANQNKSQSGNQGGSHQQHVEAGRQSHKNDDNKQSGSKGSGSGSGSGTRGGTREQHAEAGRQSLKTTASAKPAAHNKACYPAGFFNEGQRRVFEKLSQSQQK